MNISQLLKMHGKHAHTISKDSPVVDAIEKMTLTKSGALIVTENDHPVGIFTEHDVFRCHMVDKTGSFSDMKVADVMSRNLSYASPDENIGHALNRMLNAQIHHLPVIESDKISGMLMINDIVRQHMEALNAELQYLHEYISRLQDAGND
jgi:signal-transduction protein with cAMP-binding, CBS, and nucleotidyltransferase domain